MKPNWQTRGPQFTDEPGFRQRLTQMFNNGILLSDNLNAAWVDGQTCVHATPTNIANPLKGAPKQIDVKSTTQPVKSWTWTYANGLIALTVYYDLPEQFAWVTASGTQSIGNNSSTAITFASSPTSLVGSNIAYNGSSTLTVSEAGNYQLVGGARFAFNATGARQIAFAAGSTTIGHQSPQAVTTTGDATSVASSVIAPLTAGQTIQLKAVQDSGGSLSTVVSPGSFLQARQVSRSGVSDMPTIIVWGG